MTDVLSAPAPAPEPSSPNRRSLVFAIGGAVLVLLGLSLFARRWVRGGGPRRAITELAEEGAVKLAGGLIDEILPAPRRQAESAVVRRGVESAPAVPRASRTR